MSPRVIARAEFASEWESSTADDAPLPSESQESLTTAILLIVLAAVSVLLTAAAVWFVCRSRRKRAAAAAAAHAKIRPLTLVARHINTDVERAQQAPAGDDDDKGTVMVDVSLGKEGEEETAKAKREAQAKGAHGWWRWGKT